MWHLHRDDILRIFKSRRNKISFSFIIRLGIKHLSLILKWNSIMHLITMVIQNYWTKNALEHLLPIKYYVWKKFNKRFHSFNAFKGVVDSLVSLYILVSTNKCINFISYSVFIGSLLSIMFMWFWILFSTLKNFKSFKNNYTSHSNR